jgi:hypothetical protein
MYATRIEAAKPTIDADVILMSFGETKGVEKIH